MKKFILNNVDNIILGSTFLPYLVGSIGLRIEHLVVYMLFLFLLFKGKIFHFSNNGYTYVIFTFFLLTTHVLLSSFINRLGFDLVFLSNFENYIETLVLFLIFNCLVNGRNYFTINRMVKINFLFHILLSLNTVLILFEILTPWADAITHFYVKDVSEGIRVGTNSMGRYMGVFDQTFVSGFGYSLGVLTWIYNITRTKNYNKFIQSLLLVMMLIGGFASVSKVFFIGGLFIAFVLLMVIGSKKLKFYGVFLLSFFLFVITPFFAEYWTGFEYLEEIFFGIINDSSFEKISSGRLGNEDGIYSLMLKEDFSLFFGKGFTLYFIGDQPVFDSEHVQIFYQGGIVAIILYAVLIFKNFSLSLQLSNKIFKEKALLISILILAVFTGFGGPVFFMNRIRIFFFLQLFFLYKLSKNRRLLNI